MLETIRLFLANHLTAFFTAVELLFIAFVCTMPVLFPRSVQEWWTWIRDGLQTAVPAARSSRIEKVVSQQTPISNTVVNEVKEEK